MARPLTQVTPVHEHGAEEVGTQPVNEPYGSESTEDFLNASKPDTSSLWEDSSTASVQERVMMRMMKNREEIGSITALLHSLLISLES